MKRFFAILGLVLLAVPLSALPAASTTLYDIEVLVFENSQPGLEGGEAWKELRKELGDIEQAATPEGAPAPDSALSQAAGALERGGQHRILVHKRWQQNADAKSATTPLRLQSANNELDGTLRFYFSRFLRVELNLALQDPRGTSGVKAFPSQRTPAGTAAGDSLLRSSQARGAGACHGGGRKSRNAAAREAGQACAISAITRSNNRRTRAMPVSRFFSISLRLIGPVALPAAGFTTTATEA